MRETQVPVLHSVTFVTYGSQAVLATPRPSLFRAREWMHD
jgi:hypothetical protein